MESIPIRWIIIDVTELIISSDSYVGRAKRNFTLLADQTVCHASSTSLLNLNCYLTIAPTGIPVTRLPSPRTVFGTTTKSIPLHLWNETRKEIDSISLPRNPAFRFSFRMDGWMDGSQYHETRGYNPPPLVKPPLESSRKKGEGRGERR